MASLRQLAESIDMMVEEASGGDVYKDALKFFDKGVLPDGSKWGGSVAVKLGFDNQPRVTRESKKATNDGFVYTARIRVSPGRGGGAGAGVDPAASNHLFNMVGTDKATIRGISKAFLTVVKKNSRRLNDGLRVWLKKPENFMHRIVGGWKKDGYKIKDVTLKSVRYEDPVVDPSRRKWPAGRTEIWTPIVSDVVITVKKNK